MRTLVHYIFLCSNFSAVLENGIMGPQKILFTTDDEFIKQKAEQLNKSSTNNFRTIRCRGLISMFTNSCVLVVLGANGIFATAVIKELLLY